MAHSKRSSRWKICPFHFFPLNELKGHCHLIYERIKKLQEQKGQFTPACGKPACSSLTCPCYSTSSLLHSPSSIWSNNRVVCDNYGKSQGKNQQWLNMAYQLFALLRGWHGITCVLVLQTSSPWQLLTTEKPNRT